MTFKRLELTGPGFVKDVKRPLSTARMLAGVVPRALTKRQGVISTSSSPGPMIVRQAGLRLSPRNVEAYREVCGYSAQAGMVPVTYPEMHFTQLIAEAVLSSGFPFSPLGLIHVGQRVQSFAPILPGDLVDATTELEELRETGRGFELDFSMSVEKGGRRVWAGLATLLSRSPAKQSAKKGKRRGDASRPVSASSERAFELTVPGNTGVRYARVSGDYNPHHLWWFTARPLGYRLPIAHGMWTFARVLSEVLDGVDGDAPLSASTVFKRPLLMPSRIHIEAPRLAERPGGVRFAAREASSGAPHLIGDAALIA
jgi:acyl dehydratase